MSNIESKEIKEIKEANEAKERNPLSIDKKLPLSLRMDRFFSKPVYRKILDSVTLIFFIIVVIGPVFNIFSTIFLSLPEIYTDVFHDPLMGDLQWTLILNSLINSFGIAAIAIIIDILLGFPISIILTRYNFRGKKILDALMDLPMAVPTSALGFSVMIFWGIFGIEPGFFLILLVHIVFTFPYILRNMKIVLENTKTLYEDAARTLGASGFTLFRTVTLPLMKEGIIAGAILGFTRSLGETGATIIVSGLVETAPLLIVGLRRQLNLPSASFLAGILIAISLILLFSIKFVSRKSKFPLKKVYPKFESFLSHKIFKTSRDIVSLSFVLIIVLIPSIFIITQLNLNGLAEELMGPDYKWAYLYNSLKYSVQIGVLSILIDMLFGLPLAFIIVKRNWGKIISLLDIILDVPIAIPSAALGFAIFMFWGPAGLGLTYPGFFMILFVHVTFTFPYMVRPIIGVLSSSNKGVEDAARTLGASNMTVFRKITFPNIKQGVIAGAIMVFTRSMGETGATIVVMGSIRTIPVLIVDWVEASAYASSIFASVLVIVLSAILLIALRYVTKRRESHA